MAYPQYWRCPNCNRIVKNSRQCYFCGYRPNYKGRPNGRKERGKGGLNKLPILIAIGVLALVLVFTFWNQLWALNPGKKEFDINLTCASPDLIVTLENKGSKIQGEWIFVVNGGEHRKEMELGEGEIVRKAFESKPGPNQVLVKPPKGEEKQAGCFL